MLGGADHILELSHKTFDGVTAQFSRCDSGHGHPMVVKEYEQGYDWMHQGEGYVFFYNLCLADPGNAKNSERARRFAGFYLNEDPDIINYDTEKKILLSPHLGSMGPAYRNWEEGKRGYPYSFWKVYPLPFLDIEGIDTVEDDATKGVDAATDKSIEQQRKQSEFERRQRLQDTLQTTATNFATIPFYTRLLEDAAKRRLELDKAMLGAREMMPSNIQNIMLSKQSQRSLASSAFAEEAKALAAQQEAATGFGGLGMQRRFGQA